MKTKTVKNKEIYILLFTLLMVVCIAAATGCGGRNGAEVKVSEDLEAMRYVELEPGAEAEINSMLTDKGKDYFEMFLAKAGEFEYEITGSKDSEVTVRITTYDFASEYLRAWSEFLEDADAKAETQESEKAKTPETEAEDPVELAMDAVDEAVNGKEEYNPYDDAELYEKLFRRLSNVKDKNYKAEVTVTCTQAEDGTWETDAKNNTELRNAILGGMLNEIAGLAELSDE